MPSRNAHRQLLLGLLALQNGFVNQAQLVAAFGVWSLDKSRSLDEVLVEQKALDEAARSLLSALVERHLASHQQDAEQSLAALPASVEIRARLSSIADPDLGASLIRLKEGDTARNEPDVTQALPVTPAGGRFVVLRPHARGGLGKVSVALDSELNRQVALKEIREEYAHDEYNQSRFVQEAEITGQLEHPGIVPVYGLGAYRDGRPYYAMRFVEGESLKAAIESFHAQRTAKRILSSDQAVSFRNLLGRFVAACHAIEYAHSRKVIHRDLKPENIMLGPYGETLVVDWGLAKSLDAESKNLPPTQIERQVSDETLPGPRARPVKLKGSSGATPTLEGSALGTPAYMSPEQALGKLAELGPGSDIYSLGATLFVLLTGQAAFKGEEVTELLEKVRRGQFALPRAIWSGVPRSLEAICLKAMAMKSADRYRSARALAEDIERYLADEAVSACVDPILVRTRRWMKRHPALVASAAATLILGLTSTLTLAAISQQHASALEEKNLTISGQLAELQQRNTTIEKQNDTLEAQNTTISRQKSDLQSQNEALELAKKEAETARKRAENVVTYLVSMFRSADPELSGKDVKVVDILDKQAARLAFDFQEDPVTRASMLSAIAQSYQGLGESNKAIPLSKLALQLRRNHLASDASEITYSMNLLSIALRDEGRFQEAEKILEEAVVRAIKTHGEDHSDTLTSKSNLAGVYRSMGQFPKAAKLFEEVLRKREELTPNDDGLLFAINDVALSYLDLSRPRDAIPLFEKALDLLTKRFGRTHPETLICHGNLADALRGAGENQKANETLRQVIAGRIGTLGEDHPQTLFAQNNLALGLQNLKQHQDAAAIFVDVLAKLEKRLGKSHPESLIAKTNLANVYLDLKDTARAEPLLAEVLETSSRDPERLATQLVYGATTYGGMHYEARRFDKAAALFRSAEQTLAKSRNPPPAMILTLRGHYANALREKGELDEAIALYEAVRKERIELLGADTPSVLFTANSLALCYQYAGRVEEGIRCIEEALPLLEKHFGAEHVDTVISKFNLADAYLDGGKVVESAKTSLEVLAVCEKQKDFDPVRFANASRMHAQALLMQKQFEQAKPFLEQSLAILEKEDPVSFNAHHTRALLGWAILGAGDAKAAEGPLLSGFQQLLLEIDQLPQGFGPKLLRINEQVILLFETQNLAEEAAKQRQKLEELKVRYSTGKRR